MSFDVATPGGDQEERQLLDEGWPVHSARQDQDSGGGGAMRHCWRPTSDEEEGTCEDIVTSIVGFSSDLWNELPVP